ncbi:MAG: tail fiber domain-containing protein [Flavobacteriaceae bacterium]
MRLKSKIQPSPIGIQEVMMLSPKIYDKYENLKKKDRIAKDIGFIVQVVQEILPLLIQKGAVENNILNLNYNALIPVLTKAIQEQQNIIEKQNMVWSAINRISKT